MPDPYLCHRCGSEELVAHAAFHINEGTFAFPERRISCTACGRAVEVALKAGTTTNSIRDVWREQYQNDDTMLNRLAKTARKTVKKDDIST